MEYRFFIIVEGSNPKIYKVPRIQTARLIGEYPDQKFQIYKTLQDAKRASLPIANRAPSWTKASIKRLTEDRVENFHFWH